MRHSSLSTLGHGLLAAGALLAAACGADEGADAAATDTGMPTAMMPMAGPDTTAEAVWAHLTSANYASSWAMWPGKSGLYAGREPHGMLLTTYVNSLAQDALTSGATLMPAGAIVVKENYMPDSTLAAITVMYKAAGYDAAHNNWFWLKRLANGTVEASGRVAGCQDCHRQAAADFIMTTALGSGSSK